MKSKNKSTKQNKTVLIVAIIALLLIGGFLLLKPKAVGQAVSIGGQPYLGDVIDLSTKESVTFTFDPEKDNEVLFLAKTSVFSSVVDEYKLSLSNLERDMFSLFLYKIIYLNGSARDRYHSTDFLSISEGMDSTRFYLDNDATADISVVYANGAVTLTNLHHLAPTGARIELQTVQGASVPLIQRVQPGEQLRLRIKAASIIPPTISVHGDANVTIHNSSAEADPQGTNYTIAYINYTAPLQSQADVLVINASVLGRNNYAYYTFAVGNVIYALARPNSPTLLLWANEQNQNFLNVTLLSTTALQPLAVPCRTVPEDAFFTNPAIKKMYSYEAGDPQVTVPAANAADRLADFNQFQLFKGYFIELKEAGSLTLQIPCANLSIAPPSGVPQLNVPIRRFSLQRGWNLLSLPGMVARPLTDFTSDNQFKLIECAQGYTCTEIARTSPLFPGQPYWVYTDQPFDIRYVEG